MGTALDLLKNLHFADALFLRSSVGQTTKHGSIFYQVYVPLRPGKNCADRSHLSDARIVIFPSDLHIQRFQNRSERVVIFSVDASGSAAMNRLGEAKGAVELMLAQAYSKRDYVALIGFRDGRADILLPPTRSLVQAKKNLAALAAGGGTPLAMGMNSALNLATLVRRSGKLPSMAFLTDGKGNIDLEGQPGRQKAMSDASTHCRDGSKH